MCAYWNDWIFKTWTKRFSLLDKMSQIFNIFNEKKYFLKFNGLRNHFKAEMKSIEENNEDEKYFHLATEILFFAKNGYRILEQMVMLNDASILQFGFIKSSLCLKCNRFVFQSSIVDEYLSLLMPFLNTMYILQDRIMPIIAKVSNTSLKPRDIQENETERKYKKYKKYFKKHLNSFHSFATDDKLLSRFTPEIQGIVKEYWKINGELIRRYRNIEQHIFDLVTHSYFQIHPEEKLIVILPDNPKAIPQNYRYSNRDAYNFFKRAFREFNFFVEKMAKVLELDEVMHTLEVTGLKRIKLEKIPDYSTVCVAISNNNGFEFCKGSGFPSPLIPKIIETDKNVQVTKKY